MGGSIGGSEDRREDPAPSRCEGAVVSKLFSKGGPLLEAEATELLRGVARRGIWSLYLSWSEEYWLS
jgi:hypothetical protein